MGDTQHKRDLGIAVDIGTTTVALSLFNVETGIRLARDAFTNPQRVFGADVISRIRAAGDGHLQDMQASICAAIAHAIGDMLRGCGQPARPISRMVVACNTTMAHILLGQPCDRLGVLPFSPAFALQPAYSAAELFGGSWDCPVTVVPWLSGFVGGDVTAGLYATARRVTSDRYLFVDAGTNGEMAFVRGEQILATSAAAGPAFEGGNLSSGSAGVAGAICSVRGRPGSFEIETIGGAPPVGLCGSGLLDTVACLLRANVLDLSGRLADPYFTQGVVIALRADKTEIAITQADIREFQLAKAAIRAGIEILLMECGAAGKPPEVVCLAGAFGQAIDPDSAAATGLLPPELAASAVGVGNTALEGAQLLLADAQGEETIASLVKRSSEINLAAHPAFEPLYIKYMLFGE